MNLKIKPGHQVNHHTAGTVLSVDHIEGGDAEAARLLAIGCIEPTEEAVTVELPLSLTAVAEMSDDELMAENQRLRKQVVSRNDDLELLREELKEAQDKAAELEAKLVEAHGEIERFKSLSLDVQPTNDEPTVEPPPTDPIPAPAPVPTPEPVKTSTRKKS